uniref:BPTI/Kunitz inhibitor domain-containing protein n=1 Tax=Acrobeloides nanus TaxID=290746 RepID=A0A914C482_9BILA
MQRRKRTFKKEEFQPVILKDDPVTTTTLASKKPNIIVKTTTTTTAPKTQEKSIKTKSTKISGVKAVVREHPDKDILSTIKLTDIRRAEEKKKPVEPIIPYENNKQAQNLKQNMLTKTSNLDKLLIPTIAKKYLELENFETPMKPLADFGYTCRREKFEIKCKNGTVDTQIVLRWFVKDDMCCSYPYGFCPGETIMADRTIRSKEECESLCLRDGIGFQSEELDGIMKELDSQKKFPSESIESAEKNKSLHIEAAKSADNKSETGIDVSNNTQSQNQTSAENGNENFDGNVKKNAAALIHGGNFAMSVEGKKPGPKKSCIREHFRAMCPDGMPSQFTIRWFVKGGMCCAYPYGYCHGESVYEEEVIRTKDECDAYCLGNEGKDLKGLRI